MTYLPPRAADSRPLTYAEDHCALRWPLVLLGTTMPILYLGMLTAPFMRAALVIHVDPKRAQLPTFRAQQALAVATSQIGTESSVWVVPTHRPDELREIIRAVPLAAPPRPPGFFRLIGNGRVDRELSLPSVEWTKGVIDSL